MSDLVNGILPVDKNKVTSEEAWEVYKDMEKFKGISFKQFNARLNDHQKTFTTDIVEADIASKAMMRGRFLFPRNKTNNRGELVFDMHPAKPLLRFDIKAGLHVGKTPAQFQKTGDEYKCFDADKFKHRIYQEV